LAIADYFNCGLQISDCPSLKLASTDRCNL
jgi:hypothetical protein